MARTGRVFPLQHHFRKAPYFPPYFLKISGHVTLSSVPQAGVIVYLIDETTDSLVAKQITDGSGNYSFTSVYSLVQSHKYHVTAQYDTGAQKYNSASQPYITPAQN